MGPDFFDSLSDISFVVHLFVFCFQFKIVLYPAIRPAGYPRTKPDISGRIPDVKKGRISGRPDIWSTQVRSQLNFTDIYCMSNSLLYTNSSEKLKADLYHGLNEKVRSSD